jgi:antitoxin HigA-1
MATELAPVPPGELLFEEFLNPRGISQYRLAKEIGVPPQRISEIVAGKRAVTADTDLRLCRFFGLSNGYWLRAQAAHDIEVAQGALAGELDRIGPWRDTAIANTVAHAIGVRLREISLTPDRLLAALRASG